MGIEPGAQPPAQKITDRPRQPKNYAEVDIKAPWPHPTPPNSSPRPPGTKAATTPVSPSRRDCPGPPLHPSHHPGGIAQDRHYTCLTIQEGLPRTAITPVSTSRRDCPGPLLYLSHHPGLTIPPSIGHVSLNPLNSTAASISKNVPPK